MRQQILILGIAVNLALAAFLASLWIDREGRVREATWTAPNPIQPDFSSPQGDPQSAPHSPASTVVATLERPLFSPSRRPPLAPLAATIEAPAADALTRVVIVGLYSGGSSGGIIANVDGISRRIAVKEQLNGWTLNAIDERDVKFVRNGETRVLQLTRARPEAVAAAASASTGSSSAAPTTSAVSPAAARNAIVQAMEEESRERLRRRNELRAKAGMPPVTQ